MKSQTNQGDLLESAKTAGHVQSASRRFAQQQGKSRCDLVEIIFRKKLTRISEFERIKQCYENAKECQSWNFGELAFWQAVAR